MKILILGFLIIFSGSQSAIADDSVLTECWFVNGEMRCECQHFAHPRGDAKHAYDLGTFGTRFPCQHPVPCRHPLHSYDVLPKLGE